MCTSCLFATAAREKIQSIDPTLPEGRRIPSDAMRSDEYKLSKTMPD